MSDTNYYTILQISASASQEEVKDAYRRLVKQFHPDLNLTTAANHERMAAINAAYEVLGDPQHRQSYDEQRQRCRTIGQTVPNPQRGHDLELQWWFSQVYHPVCHLIDGILEPLPSQLNALAADPFDDDLMAEFQSYLDRCQQSLALAQRCFQMMPNPTEVAKVATNLFYCLSLIGDGLEEMDRFSQCFNDYYLHTGQELFRHAANAYDRANV
ncbi:DnaJ domain-containing protein [Candidatus Synechococcus calcipolaris G9]|uniref:DnaJ domain-containing protein n=1 Tax=Candidatus Synechococcus calcipolaris G9 TaxID=1497997 RepID=A0ABT6F0Y9_9SYNE|nr:DnaJ domain-containing protein [Candidatus Synechococcus calcipolaris]MDG2991526.1 DnaJ domain-containing protein [Candidatus Synechococcus calcipolaris G9]